MKGKNLIGKLVNITDKDSCFYGSWGKIIDFDGDYYHIKDLNGDITPIFDRKQFKIKKTQTY